MAYLVVFYYEFKMTEVGYIVRNLCYFLKLDKGVYKLLLRRKADILFMPDALNLVLRMYCSSSLR